MATPGRTSTRDGDVMTALKYAGVFVGGCLFTFFIGIPLYFILDYLKNGSRQ